MFAAWANRDQLAVIVYVQEEIACSARGACPRAPAACHARSARQPRGMGAVDRRCVQPAARYVSDFPGTCIAAHSQVLVSALANRTCAFHETSCIGCLVGGTA